MRKLITVLIGQTISIFSIAQGCIIPDWADQGGISFHQTLRVNAHHFSHTDFANMMISL
ncbi:MAG: hypothetical protein JKY48_10100 [Flavobacteriales bacterium]|nr:hypothetical protein [Flavobacteriales bacterium]